MAHYATTQSVKRTKVRWFMTFLITLVTCLCYVDRANLAVAAPVMAKHLHLNAAAMGIVFSAFGWSYTVCVPFAGVLLDRFGPRILYTIGIIGWSIVTCLFGFTNSIGALIGCRLGVGAFESPTIPTNIRCITAWHPTNERALAAGVFNAGQFIGLGFFTPLLAWIVVRFGWQSMFFVTGVTGLIVAWIWHHYYRDPKDAVSANQDEIQYILAGGGFGTKTAADGQAGLSWGTVRQLLVYRQVLALLIGQLALGTALFFFLTWFPSYLVTAKGLGILRTGFYATIPFLVGLVGSVLGGRWSDWMMSKRYSHSIARKLPICLGFVLTAGIIGANYTNYIPAVIAFMAISFLGTSIVSPVIQALTSDIAPQGRVGMLSGMEFFCGNVAGLFSPLIVGFIVHATGRFNLALAYVAAMQIIGLICYIFVMGPISRIKLAESAGK
jgi:ACS family D-galactonate transporter-like MFS transporter